MKNESNLNVLSFILLIGFISGCVGPSTPAKIATSDPEPPPMLTETATTQPTPALPLLPVRGLYVQFERRGYPNDYWSGQAINEFFLYDEIVGQTVAEEISEQLNQIKSMGVNTIAFELRSSAPEFINERFTPPNCNISPALGLQYPQPTDLEVTNLKAFLDLLELKGFKVFLRLVNTHMEDRTNSEIWLRSILTTIKDHPALDLVLFEGSPFLVDTNGDSINDECGGPAEPGLWEGPSTISAQYVKWAIDLGHSIGLPYRQLSAQSIVGNYFTMQHPPNDFMTDGHFWEPVEVMKLIFDELSVPEGERTYALSFYEHRKCSTANDLPCEDTDPHSWAIETAEAIFAVVGRDNGARVVAVEMGALPPVTPDWPTEKALESLVWVMHEYGIGGGCFWRWTSFDNNEDVNPNLAIPIKLRGEDYAFTPVKDVLERLYTQGVPSEFSSP